MTVQAFTDFFPNLTVSPFIENGAIVKTSDQHGSNNTYIFDGINDHLTTIGGTEPFTASSGSQHSLGFWLKTTYNGGAFVQVCCQYNNTAQTDAVFFVGLFNSGTFDCTFISDTTANKITSRFTYPTDGLFHHYICTVNGNDLNIFQDGLEVSYTTTNLQNGTGFTGVKSGSITDLTVGATLSPSQFLDGVPSRLKFWRGATLSVAEALEEFNNEIVAIGGLTQSLLTTLDSSSAYAAFEG